MRNRALVALLLCLVLPAAAWAHDSALSEVPGGSITAHVGGQPVQEEFHGDPIPPGADVEFRAAVRRAALARVAADSASITPLAPSLTWCGIETATDDTAHAAGGAGPSIKLVYAHAADQPDHFAQYADLIQGDVATIFGSILSTSGNLKSVRFDMGTACGARFVDVVSLTLPRTRATYQAMSFSSRITAMRSDLHPQLSSIAGTHDFLVYADGLYANDGITGVASLYDDDQPGAANASNTGGLFGFVLGNGGATFGLSHGRTAEHELSHNLGAVQDSAPHSTLAGHCFENYDVMCYADGGTSGQPSNMVTYDDCPNGIPQPYDCHQDDYFSANPARGSYLATHWNVFNSVFLCPVAACITDLGDVPPTASVALSPTAPAPGDQVTFDGTASRDDGGPIATYSWDAGNDGTVDGTQPTFSHTYPDAGSYTVKLTVTDAGGKAGSVTRSFNVGTVVAAPPAPVVAPPRSVHRPDRPPLLRRLRRRAPRPPFVCRTDN